MKKLSLTRGHQLIIGLLFTASGAMGQSVEEAMLLLEKEKFKSAADAIQEVLKGAPSQADNYYYAGYIYLLAEKPDSAQYFFDKGVKLDETAPLSYVGQGYLNLDKGDIPEAEAHFNKALLLSKEKDAVVYNKIADAFLHAGNKDAKKALPYLEKALVLKKKKEKEDESRVDAETYMLMGDAYLDLGKGGEAVGSYEKAIEKDGRFEAKGHTKIGRIYLMARSYDAALAEFEKALQADASYAPVYKDLGEIYFTHKKDVGKAKEMYRKYLDLSDVKTGSRSRYAAFLYVSKDFENAIKEIRASLGNQPGDIVMNRLLGYSLYKTNAYEEAAQAFKKYFELVKPNETLASDYEYLGLTLMELGRDSLAIENFQSAIQKDSSNIAMLENAAQTFKKDKKYKPSAQLYEMFLNRKIKPGTNDYYEAGKVYLDAQLYDQAEAAFEKVIQLSPNHYIGYYMMANTKFYRDQEGKQGLAKPYYEKVIEILEADKASKNLGPLITAYSYMATYYTQKQDLETAKTYWEKVKGLDPANAHAKQFFDYLQEVEAFKAKSQKKD